MPHVVLNGKISVEEIFEKLNPLFIRHEYIILRTKETYLEKNKKDILIDSLAIEKGKKTVFLALISGRDDGVVVRLYPQVEVEKTDSVKTVLAELAKQVMQTFPEMQVGETNLQDFLK
ncbi:MAG: hypothetical protein ACQCN3_14715 [Candidatus Bathyarchaeia archaeon]